jgi:hypothetical protein
VRRVSDTPPVSPPPPAATDAPAPPRVVDPSVIGRDRDPTPVQGGGDSTVMSLRLERNKIAQEQRSFLRRSAKQLHGASLGDHLALRAIAAKAGVTVAFDRLLRVHADELLPELLAQAAPFIAGHDKARLRSIALLIDTPDVPAKQLLEDALAPPRTDDAPATPGRTIDPRLAAAIAEVEAGNVRFPRLIVLCTKFFGPPRINGSHHIFQTPFRDAFVNLQPDTDSSVKPYQLRQALTALERLAGTS